MKIGHIEIGAGNPTRFIAEISGNHNGDFDRAIRLIDAAKATGADFVKFQCFEVSELIALRGDGPAPEPWGSQGWTMESLYRKAQTPLEWFPKLAQHCKDIEMPWFSSVFGPESLACLEAVDCPAYKIARLDAHHESLVTDAGRTGKPLLMSNDNKEWEPGGAWAIAHGLYCPEGYPPTLDEIYLPDFKYRNYLGLSSHCLDPLLPVAAVARGCSIIEMHMMLADEPSELESNVSLTEIQFKELIDNVRRVEIMLA